MDFKFCALYVSMACGVWTSIYFSRCDKNLNTTSFSKESLGAWWTTPMYILCLLTPCFICCIHLKPNFFACVSFTSYLLLLFLMLSYNVCMSLEGIFLTVNMYEITLFLHIISMGSVLVPRSRSMYGVYSLTLKKLHSKITFGLFQTHPKWTKGCNTSIHTSTL